MFCPTLRYLNTSGIYSVLICIFFFSNVSRTLSAKLIESNLPFNSANLSYNSLSIVNDKQESLQDESPAGLTLYYRMIFLYLCIINHKRLNRGDF